MSSIHQTNHGTYKVRYRENGRQRAKTFRRKADAKKFVAEVTLGQTRQPFPNKVTENSLGKTTFSEFSQIWLRDHGSAQKEESSLIRDRQILRDYLNPALGHLPLASIRKHGIVKLQAAQARRCKSRKSVNNIVGLASTILEFAVEWEYLSTNPAKRVHRLDCPDVEITYWGFEERDRFLSFIKRENHSLWEIFAFTVHTGLRRGEVQGLLRDCLDFGRREITVKRSFCTKTKRLKEQTKGKKIRRVPMNDLVYSILISRRLIGLKEKVFKWDFEHIAERYLKPNARKAGVTVIHFHGLRHTFASHLIMCGVSVFDVQKLLGHSDIKTTLQYAHLAPDQLRDKTAVLLTGPVSENRASEAEVINLS